MKTLDPDWITHGYLDLEYKQYLLLAYLKEVKQSFSRAKLYPFLGDLIFHYNNLQRLKRDKELLQQDFPKRLQKINLEKLRLNYHRMLNDDAVMQPLEEIIHYALNTMKPSLEEVKEIYEFVESNVRLEPVGLTPLYRNEGYFFLNEEGKKELKIFRFRLSTIQHSNEDFKSLTTKFIRREGLNFFKTVQRIKLELIKLFSELPNPATYLITSSIKFPIEETLLPVSKRLLIRELSK